MIRHPVLPPLAAAVLCLALAGPLRAADSAAAPAARPLPPPSLKAGLPLMQALKLRQTQRQFSPKPLPPQLLGNLLWAANGVNRPQSGKRTAPTACDWREIDVYVATADGLFLYDPPQHALLPVLPGDLRAQCTVQRFIKPPPVVLIFVADTDRMGESPEADRIFYSATDTGFASQNVYLFAASEKLATVVCGMVNRNALAPAMKLRPAQKIILTQPIGYPPAAGDR
ncbi:MAG: SagB/ThcOx family dehydrogenase [Lentisphaeria bacterium]